MQKNAVAIEVVKAVLHTTVRLTLKPMRDVSRNRTISSRCIWDILYLYNTNIYVQSKEKKSKRKSALISASQSIQPGNQRTVRDHAYRLVYHAVYLFNTPPAFAGYSF